MKSIIVFGSINLDLVTKTPRLPVKGETLQGYEFFTAPGGKGANQAVAAARLGISTYMIGRLGDDDFGRQLLSGLKAAGVHTEGILVDDTASSGVAIITVDDAGENNIIIVAGVNGRVNQQDVERLTAFLSGVTDSELVEPADSEPVEPAVLLLQLEIPIAVVLAAAQSAHNAGILVILDPAPAASVPPELFSFVDIITPNEIEASQLVGFPVDGKEAAHLASIELLKRGVGTVIIKLGAQGVFCATTDESFFVPAFAVQVVDTVAAGDAFNGTLAVALAQGHSLREAIVWGAAAGAICATSFGAQPSLADRETFEAFLKARGVMKQ